MISARRFLLIAFLGGSLSARGQQVMTLQQCIDYALAHNLTVRQQDVARRRSALELTSGRNERLPQVAAQGGYAYSMGRSLTENNTYANSNTQNVQLSLSASVPLFTGFRIRHQISQSRLNLAAATADLAKPVRMWPCRLRNTICRCFASRNWLPWPNGRWRFRHSRPTLAAAA